MKKEIPISINRVNFCSFTIDEKKAVGKDIWQFTFDRRQDFYFDDSLGGIAAEIYFCNNRALMDNPRGVRRKITLILIDTTARTEIDSITESVYILKDNYIQPSYVYYLTSTAGFKPNHEYKLIIKDDATGVTLGEYVFHLFGGNNIGQPTEWYYLEDGGIRPEWQNQLYCSVKAITYKDYYIRFDLHHRFGFNPPAIFPELEIRLYDPDMQLLDVHFMEPRLLDYDMDIYFVESKLHISKEYHGVFYAELRCMKQPIAGLVFETHRKDIKGHWLPKEMKPLAEHTTEAAEARLKDLLPEIETTDDCTDGGLNPLSVQERNSMPTDNKSLLSSLDRLTGLNSVKQKLLTYERIVRFNKMRADNGLPVSSAPLHAMFLGAPGTGKTTIAKMMGLMLRRAGLLSRGHVVVRERATLLGKNYSSESENTLAAIEEAQGGILLIDEAYQLYQPSDPRDPGKFVIETLLTSLADKTKRDWMLILAGYPEEMQHLFDMNPGLKSRIPDANIYKFEDFTEFELMRIAKDYLHRHQYKLSPAAESSLSVRIGTDYDQRGRNFGNARYVINLIETEILPAMASRVIAENETGEQSLTDILPVDIPLPTPGKNSTRRQVGFL